MLQLKRVEYHNMGPYKDFVVDLSKYQDKLLIAICGENGVGKTFFLESAFAGAMYRTMPTQGTLVKRAKAKDSWMASTLVNGATRTFRHVVDGVSGKSEAIVLDENGAALLSDSKVRSFDAWAAQHCPPPEVTFASLFAAQNSSGFLRAKPAERKSILLRVLGIERLELLAARAGEHVRDTRAALSTLSVRIEDEKERLGAGVAELEATLAESRRALAAAESDLADARAAVEQAHADAVLVEQRTWEVKTIRDRREELAGRLKARRADVADIEERLRNNQAILADEAKIRAAEASVLVLRAEAAGLGSEQLAAEQRRLAAVSSRDGHERARAAAEGRAKTARERAMRARARLADRETIESAVRVLPARREACALAKTAAEQARADLDAVRSERLQGVEARITGLRGALDTIRVHRLLHAHDVATEALTADDQAVADAAARPKRMLAAESALLEALGMLADEEKLLKHFEVVTAKLPDLAAAAREESEANADALLAVEEADAARVARDVSAEAAVEHEESRSTALARVNAVKADLAQLEPLASRAPNLAAAAARIATHTTNLVAARADLATLDETFSATPEPEPPPPMPEMARHSSRAESAEASARHAASDIALLEQRVADGRASEERLAMLTAERTQLEVELAEWTRLAADLGRDGIQALEIDAAGPELTEMVNDLLHSCFGTRWTITIETTKLSADGKRQLEGCEVMVLDTVDDSQRPGEEFSGGEKAILETAMSLGLMMLACKRTGSKDCTLVRDESGAAVSKGNVRAYVAMLRRAAARVGASHVLLVSHVPEVIDLCDDRIDIPSGGSGVASPKPEQPPREWRSGRVGEFEWDEYRDSGEASP